MILKKNSLHFKINKSLFLRLMSILIALICFLVLFRSFYAGGIYQLAEYAQDNNLEWMPIPQEKISDGFFLHIQNGWLPKESYIPYSDSIEINFTTSSSSDISLKDASINIGECSFNKKKEVSFVKHGKSIFFYRTKECSPKIYNKEGNFELKLVTSQPEKILLPILVRETTDPGIRSEIYLKTEKKQKIVLYGSFKITNLPSSWMSKLERLVFVWDMFSPASILLILGTAFLFYIFALSFFTIDKPHLFAISCFFISISIGILYATIIPPFHAPDEIDHFLGFKNITGSETFLDEVKTLSKRGHFERLKFRALEKFLGDNTHYPFSKEWSYHIEMTKMEKRSPITYIVWKMLWSIPGVNTLNAQQLLYLIRLLNVLVFSLCMYVSILLFYKYTKNTPHFQIPLYFILLIPTLPFFAMHVSDYAILTSIYILYSTIIVSFLYIESEDFPLFGFLLGSISSIAFFISRSSIPLLFLVFVIILLKIILHSKKSKDFRFFRRRMILFNIFFIISFFPVVHTLSSYITISDSLYYFPIFTGYENYSLILSGLFFIFFLLGFILETSLFFILKTFLFKQKRLYLNLIKYISISAAFYILIVLLISNKQKLPFIPNIELYKDINIETYLKQTFLSFLSFFRMRNNDYFLQVSFFGGFGWLDTLPPELLIGICSSSIGIFLTYKWFKIGVEKNTNLFLGYLFLFFGLAISLLIYAGANYYTDRVNLHGRYLIGFYLIIISASWISAPEMFLQILQIFKLGSDTAKTILIFLFSVLPIVLHTYLVVFILSRYF